MNHDEPVSDNLDVIRKFDLVSRQWMKHVSLLGDTSYKAKGDPDEVKATLDDLSRMFAMAKEKMLPTLSDDLGINLRKTYALIAVLFYFKNNMQITQTRAQSVSKMVGLIDGKEVSEDYLLNLISENGGKNRSITDVIQGFNHDRVLKALVTMDKISNAGFEGGLAMVHFVGVQLLLKTLCAENSIDYDLDEFCMECVESFRNLFSEKWQETSAYRMNDSMLVIRESDHSTSASNPQKRKTTTKKKEPAKKNVKKTFPSPDVSHIRTQYLSNTEGYAVRFISLTEAKHDSSEEEALFRDRMTWLHSEYPDTVSELIKNADKFSALLASEEERRDVLLGRFVNTAPIHALRSILWTALNMDDSADPFADASDTEYWLSMAEFIGSHDLVNYKPFRKDEDKPGRELIRKEEIKLSY